MGKKNKLNNMINILNPLLIFHEYGKFNLIREYGVTANSLHWREPGIATTQFVLDAFRKLEYRELDSFLQNYEQNIINFLLNNFDHNIGGFKQNSKSPPTIYATYLALNIINRFYDRGRDRNYFDPLGKKRACDVLGIERIKKIESFIENSWDKDTGGYLEGPSLGYQATVPRTNAAYLALRHLGSNKYKKEKIIDFLKLSCLKESKNGGIGFSAIQNGEPLSCSTWFALKLLQELGQETWIEENKEYIRTFLKSCWSETQNKGGFGGKPGIYPTLAHTCLVVSCVYEIFDDCIVENGDHITQNKIINFVRSCQSNGGFSFIGKIAPDAYSTRNTIKLTQFFKPDFNFSKLFDKQETIEFFYSSLFDENTKMFRGYSNYETTRFLKKFRNFTDKMLMPKDPFKKTQLNPFPYFITGISSTAIFLIGIFLYLKSDSFPALYLCLGSLALVLSATAGIIKWFIKR